MNSKKILGPFLFIGLLLFGWVLKFGYFFSDDFYWLYQAQRISGFSDVLFFKISTYHSPVLNFFYYVFYNLFYYQAHWYFLATILVHILVAYFLFLFIYKITKKKSISLFSAMFFLLAGSAYEPIFWIAANLHVFATIFILLFIYFYWQFLNTHKIKHFIISFLFFLLAINTKEIAFISIFLMLATYLFFKFKNKETRAYIYNKILVFLIFIVTIVFGFLEYIWQRNSPAINSGYWQLDFSQFLRWPVIIVDTIIPFFRWINIDNYFYIYTLSLILIISLIYFLKKSLLFWYGLSWILIASLPTIFAVDKLWMPLASRYTYLLKIGTVFILCALLARLLKKVPKKIVYIFIFSLFVYNVFYWVNIVKKDYPYVYQSGRALKEVVLKIAPQNPANIFMVRPLPFEGNTAHIVGAFSTLMDYPKEKIIFIDQENLPENPNGIIVYWDHQKRVYFFEDLSQK
jgi:hypothetical protein